MVRLVGSMVVSKSCLAFISPRPLKRLISMPRLPISGYDLVEDAGDAENGVDLGVVAFAFDDPRTGACPGC